MNKPTTGTLYERSCNDGITALIIDAIQPLDGGWLCLALLLTFDMSPIAVQQIVLTADDVQVYTRGATVDVVSHLAAIRQQQIDGEMTVKEAQRAERLADLYIRQAAYLTRQLLRPAKAANEWTCADQLEAEAAGVSHPTQRRHPDNLNCFVGVPGCSLRGEAK